MKNAREKELKTQTMRSMTQGRPLPIILRFMLPVLLGQLIQTTYNMVDAMIVGRMLGADALAAVGATGSVQFMVLGFCSGSCDGFAIPIAQRFGAKEESSMRSYIYHAAILAAAFAVVLCGVGTLLTPQIIRVLRTPSNISAEARIYLRVIFLGLPFTFFYNIQASILRAVGNSRIPFIFLSISACLNIFLDLLCVAVLHWGVAGAALATITSQALSGLMSLLYILRSAKELHPMAEERRWSRHKLRVLLSMGLPMGLQFSITAIGSMVLQAGNNSLGSVYVAGYTAASKVDQLIMCPQVALSSAVATYVGQNLGAGKIDRIRQGVKSSSILAYSYGVVFGLLLAFFGKYLAALFLPAGSGEILAAADRYLFCIGLGFWMVSSVNVYRPTIQGLGFPLRAIFSGVFEMVTRVLFVTITLPFWGFMTTCWANQAAWCVAGVYVYVMYGKTIRKLELMFE